MEQKETIEQETSQRELAEMAIDMFHRTVMHHVLWFKEVEHQMGFERALEIMGTAYDKSRGIQLKRLGKLLGFDLIDGIPEPLLNMPKEKLEALIEGLGINWLAGDGVWFQAVESQYGMLDAKRCNDSCWAWFSPFEAWSIKRLLNLPEQAGIEGLKKALQYRMYAKINIQSIIDERPNSILFQMNDCRVQSARKSKGMDDYPCKSAGMVEYTNFARAIDSRIKTECIGCPPDNHPEEWFCAWRFFIE
ncbi:MAG: DUF6125 family protein [Eubacteriales bacterium]|nr:DUF6125 family protein [Eubacteriales bacterium]MDD3349358.1 DUF6125 family protein [Eubacteriales bacterium]